MVQVNLKQHYVENGIVCNLAPPTISECNTTVINTNWQQLCYIAQDQVMGGRMAETEWPFSHLQDTAPPTWFWSCYL